MHVGRRGARSGRQEVRVDLGHPGAADPSSLHPGPVEQGPGGAGNVRWQGHGPRIRIPECAAGTRHAEGLGLFSEREGRPRPPAQDGWIRRLHPEVGREQDSSAPGERNAPGAEPHGFGPDRFNLAHAVNDAQPRHQFAHLPAAEVGVPVDRAPHGTRGARPGLQRGKPALDAPANEPVHRHSGESPDRPGVHLPGAAPLHPDHRAVNPVIGHQHVGPSAEQGDRQPAPPRRGEGPDQLRFAAGLDEPVGRSSEPERRQRSERVVRPKALSAGQRTRSRAHRVIAVREYGGAGLSEDRRAPRGGPEPPAGRDSVPASVRTSPAPGHRRRAVRGSPPARSGVTGPPAAR